MFLEYYSTQFNNLELNGTYYRIPTAEQMRNMIDKSGGKIKFTVKVFKEITHGGDTRQYKTCFYNILYIIFFCIFHAEIYTW